MVAAAVIGGAALSAGASMIGSSQAAGAAGKAAGVQQQQYAQTRSDLLPYNQAGQTALPTLEGLATSGPNAGGPNYIGQAAGMRPDSVFTQADLEKTPGYQFTQTQGLKATQSAAAARGLGVSGAALKGAAAYATGLADSTYSNRFNEAQTAFSDVLGLNTAYQGNVQNQYTRAQGLASLGENAGAQTGSVGATLAGNQGNYLNQQGLAQAAGATGVGNAVTGGINSYLGYNALQSYLGNKSGGTGGYMQDGQANVNAGA
jgi:hypothetical protein